MSTKGYKFSDEQRRRLSIAHIGIVHTPEWNKRVSNAKKGKRFSIEHKLKLSAARKRLFSNGFKPWNWIEDRMKLKKGRKQAFDKIYRDWSKRIKDRDGWKCKIASENCHGRLESHHIFSWIDFPELRYDINNGITLCHAHHPRKKAEEKRLAPIFMELVSASK